MEIDIEHLEYLSKLKIEDDKKEQFVQDFSKILDFVDEITKLEITDVKEKQGVQLCDLREDIAVKDESFDPLKNAPKQKDGCYQVPQVVE